jgi:hypothetical protein
MTMTTRGVALTADDVTTRWMDGWMDGWMDARMRRDGD